MVEKDLTPDEEDETDIDRGTTQAATTTKVIENTATWWHPFLEKVSLYFYAEKSIRDKMV